LLFTEGFLWDHFGKQKTLARRVQPLNNKVTSVIMIHLGFKKICALEGGRNKWLEAGFPTEPR